MKILYFIESKTGKLDCHSHFYPIGVWVKGPSPGFDIKFAFLTGYEEQQIRAEMTVIRAMAAGLTEFTDGFMEYHQEALNGYNGDRGPIIETDVYDTLVECAEAVLGMICKHYEENPPDVPVIRRALF